MARVAGDQNFAPVLNAATEWIEGCLIDDGSILSSTDRLWTPALVAEVREAFVEHPDTSKEVFIAKLKKQLSPVSPAGKQLMAEMLWALLLFQSNVNPATKRQHILGIWELSGHSLDSRHPHLADSVLEGVGSAGPGFGNHRPLELAYFIGLVTSLKKMGTEKRRSTLKDYDAFTKWLEDTPREGNRQFRHMLRWLAFPDRVERMSSTREFRRVLDAFGVAPRRLTTEWSDRQLDDAMLALRTKLERDYPGLALDFYVNPLRGMWIKKDDSEDEETDGDPVGRVAEPAATVFGTQAQNLILYGPPGTGKTFWIQQKLREYTDEPTSADSTTWLQDTLAGYGWRAVIAAVLAGIGKPARVADIRDHEWLQSKAKQRGRNPANVQQTIWAFLQEHTPVDVRTVATAVRREPFLFTKSSNSEWSLLKDWREADEDSARLFDVLKAGPREATDAVRRFRMVTFHPSYSYEDFIRGIRPVEREDGTMTFRVVDGVLKQICDEARANPARRYALFIDEINRANIAKVFGELIALIEVDKRASYNSSGRQISGMSVQLPGGESGDTTEAPFAVPDNLDIFGTMNTADRSIALLDVALRRRFEFQEMEPDYEILDRDVDGVHLGSMLQRVNDRLEYLLDRDHRIGHAYLMGATSIAHLQRAFKTQIIPLLQEYFFDDLSRAAQVLAVHASSPPFVSGEPLRVATLFPRGDERQDDRNRWRVTPENTWTAASFIGLYAASPNQVAAPQS